MQYAKIIARIVIKCGVLGLYSDTLVRIRSIRGKRVIVAQSITNASPRASSFPHPTSNQPRRQRRSSSNDFLVQPLIHCITLLNCHLSHSLHFSSRAPTFPRPLPTPLTTPHIQRTQKCVPCISLAKAIKTACE